MFYVYVIAPLSPWSYSSPTPTHRRRGWRSSGGVVDLFRHRGRCHRDVQAVLISELTHVKACGELAVGSAKLKENTEGGRGGGDAGEGGAEGAGRGGEEGVDVCVDGMRGEGASEGKEG